MPKGEAVIINRERFINLRRSVKSHQEGFAGLSRRTIRQIEDGHPVLHSTASEIFAALGMPKEFFLCRDAFDYRSFDELFSRFIFGKAELDPVKKQGDACALDSYMRSAHDDELRLPPYRPAVARSDAQESIRREALLPEGFFEPFFKIVDAIGIKRPIIGSAAASVSTWNTPEFSQALSARGLEWIGRKGDDLITFMAVTGELLDNLRWNPQKYVSSKKAKTKKSETGPSGHFAENKERSEGVRLRPEELSEIPALIIVDATHSLAPAAEAFASYIDLAGRAEILITASHLKAWPDAETAVDASAAFLRLMSIPQSRIFVDAAASIPGRRHLVFASSCYDAARIVLSARFSTASDAQIHVACARSAYGALTFLRPDRREAERLWKKIITEYALIARSVYCED